MEYRVFGKSIYARFDKGDEILKGIEEICKSEGVKTASVSGIGGCGDVVVGTFVLDKRDYEEQRVSGMLEMLSLTGNVTLKDGEPFVHAHAVFSYIDDAGKPALIGGHLKKALVILTGEIVINFTENGTNFTEKDANFTENDADFTENCVIKREKNENLGINIWKFPPKS